MMEQVFILAATIVRSIGLLPALLFVGLVPWYIGGFYIWKSGADIGPLKRLGVGAASLVLGLVMSSVLVISAMVAGRWG